MPPVKKILIGAGGLLLVGGVTLFTDAKINPFTDKIDSAEVRIVENLTSAGESKVEVSKNLPEIRLKKWNGEIDLGIKYDSIIASGTRPFLTNKFAWKGTNEELNVYPVSFEGDEGIEIDIILDKKPVKNVFDFQIEGAESLDFFYQPALTQQEIDKGTIMPENVIGSYAVYHKTRKNHQIGLTNYATGKAFHIYRPEVIDADGKEEWGILDYQNGILSVTVPQDFLDTAVYPIRIDPTLAFRALGSVQIATLAWQGLGTVQHGRPEILPEAGTLSSIHVGLEGSAVSETIDAFAALYREDSAGANSHNLVASVEILDLVITTTAGFKTFTAASETLTSNDDYIMSILLDYEDIAGVGEELYLRGDVSGPSVRKYIEETDGAGAYATRKAEDPWTEVDASDTNIYSIYVTYAEPSRVINATNYTYCRTVTSNNNGYTDGIATTTIGLFPLVATSTVSSLAATSSSGNIQLIGTTTNPTLFTDTPIDVIFVDESTCSFGVSLTAIPHYFEKYASTTGAFTVHLGTSNISSTTAKVLAMYYGNANAIDLNSPGQTYATSSPINPVGIWDLSVPEFATTTSPDFTDSTYNANNGQSNKMNNADLVTGYIDGALDFDGSNDYVDVGKTASLKGLSKATISLWYKARGTPSIEASLYYESTNTSGFGRFALSHNSNGDLRIIMRDTNIGSAFIATDVSGGANNIGKWIHLVATVDAATDNLLLYRNGVQVGNNTTAKGPFTSDDPVNPITIGAYLTNYINGLIDEVRVYKQALSTADILTIYNNTSDSTTFWTFGNEQTQGAGGADNKQSEDLEDGWFMLFDFVDWLMPDFSVIKNLLYA